VPKSKTVIELRKLLARVSRTPLQFLRLLHNDAPLKGKDDTTVEEAGLAPEATVHLTRVSVQGASLFMITHDDEILVDYLLQCRADVDEVWHRGESGETPLHYAARLGFAQVCKDILVFGSPVTANAKTDFGRTALHGAARFGHAEVVTVLLRAGSGFEMLNLQDKAGMTALHLASLKGSVRSCNSIMFHDAFTQVNACDKSGRTALHCAATAGHADVCALILACPQFSAFRAQNNHNQTALELAAVHDHHKVCDVFREHEQKKTGCSVQ